MRYSKHEKADRSIPWVTPLKVVVWCIWFAWEVIELLNFTAFTTDQVPLSYSLHFIVICSYQVVHFGSHNLQTIKNVTTLYCIQLHIMKLVKHMQCFYEIVLIHSGSIRRLVLLFHYQLLKKASVMYRNSLPWGLDTTDQCKQVCS